MDEKVKYEQIDTIISKPNVMSKPYCLSNKYNLLIQFFIFSVQISSESPEQNQVVHKCLLAKV